MILWKHILTATVIVGAGTGFAHWRIQAARQNVLTHEAILLDKSDSFLNNIESRLGLVDLALRQSPLSRGAMLTIMITGDLHSQDEPRAIGEYEIPATHRVFDGKNAIVQKREEILADLRGQLQDLSAQRSPIFLAVKRGIEVLRSNGCISSSECRLFVQTDGEENAEVSLKNAIASKDDAKSLSGVLHNEGITIAFCGLSETAGRPDKRGNPPPVHDAIRVNRIQKVWLSLFTEPESVSFAPFCPKATLEEKEAE
jgi:hypothetical protein